MIAALAGTLVEKHPERVVIDVQGVGYEVHVSLQTFAELPAPGTAVRLLVHTEVREDAIELFGFLLPLERALFRLLRKVKGLGPRTALGVLSGMPASRLAAAIAAGEGGALRTIPGVGRRFAERIVLECREAAQGLVGPLAPAASAAAVPADAPSEEAVSALMNLGYRRPEAERAVARASRPGAPLEEVLRAALQGLAG